MEIKRRNFEVFYQKDYIREALHGDFFKEINNLGDKGMLNWNMFFSHFLFLEGLDFTFYSSVMITGRK